MNTVWSGPEEVPNNEMPIPLGKKTLTNNCDDTGKAEYHDGQWIYPPCQLKTYALGITKTFTNTYTWSRAFTNGVKYSAGASFSFKGLGINAGVESSHSTTKQETYTNTTTTTLVVDTLCHAEPNTSVDCVWTAYPITMRYEYTIQWSSDHYTTGYLESTVYEIRVDEL